MKKLITFAVFAVISMFGASRTKAQLMPPGFGEPPFVQIIDVGQSPKIFIVKVATLNTVHIAFQTETGPSITDLPGIGFFDIGLSSKHLDELIYALQKVQTRVQAQAHRRRP